MPYRYSECGLDDVLIYGLDPERFVDGERGIGFPRIGRLHRVIAAALLARPGPLAGRELRFLRTEVGLTPADIASRLGVSEREVTRWEASAAAIPEETDVLVRRLVTDALDLPVVDIAPQARRADEAPILIDGSDPMNYRVLEPEAAR
ncbi:helix-turn-helix domain-containing protein [Salinarimonas ramus]|uniref:Transcriptional regulator n=1 Tax=Salinarimonas ramus TaxID=690164 RepID=A0A917V2F2_9HYPH|nr:helix-turn-helix domain-containing protein [Salinarimonas ramus]GGK23273.1 transcriptional regulator [Salinarimonas ramus]